MATKQDMGSFLSQLAQNADAATAETLQAMKDALQKEKQEQVKAAVTRVYREIQLQVNNLREVRKREMAVLVEIKRLEGLANDIVSGKAEAPIVGPIRVRAGY